MNGMDHRKENTPLSILKYIAAILIAVSHCLPISGSAFVNEYFGQWFFRFCVPLFFISSGYFFELADNAKKKRYLSRIAIMYVVCNIIYLPITLDRAKVTGTVFKDIVLGSMTHLWYLSALLFALILFYMICKIPKSHAICCMLMPLLLAAGIYFDEYCGIFPNDMLLPLKGILDHIGGARHALFFALPMLLIGKILARCKRIMDMPAAISLLLSVAAFAVSFFETRFLFSRLGPYITNDITLFNFLPSVFLFILTFGIKDKIFSDKLSVSLRKQADMLFFSHFWFVEIYNRLFNYDYRYRTVTVIAVSCVFSFAAVRITELLKKKNI